MKKLSQEQKSEEVDFAYKTIEAFKLSFDKAQANPDVARKVFSELLNKFSSLFEAVIILTENEHKQVVYEMTRSYVGMVKVWARNKL